MTQLILNIVMLFWFSNVFTFYVMMFGVIELIVFIAEAMAYCYLIKGEEAPSRSRLWAYSFAANLASMLLGFVITSALPETLQL